MANELLAIYATPSLASTIYGVVTRGGTQKYNTSGTPAFEATNTAHWAGYAVFLADSAGIGEYLGNLPAGVAAGSVYAVYYYLKSGGSPAPTDLRLSYETFYWDGTNKLDSAAPYAAGLPLQLGDGVTTTYGTTSLTRQAGTPKVATDVTGQQLRAIAATANTGAYAVVTNVAGGGVVNFSGGWVGGLPTGPLTYVFEPVSATGGGGTAPTVQQIRQEIDTNSTQLAKLGTPANGSLSADIAGVATGAGLFVAGTVSAVSSAAQFVLAFSPAAPAGPQLVNAQFPLYACNTSVSPLHAPAKQPITSATTTDATHVLITVNPPFAVAPSVGDTFLIG